MDHSAVTATAFSRPQEKSPTAGNKGFLTRIESVRGLAALCVALTHARGFLLLIDHDVVLLDRSSLRDFVLDVFDGFFNGETAVILFFVISGVVIGRALDARRSDFVPFLIRRGFRLYPAHIVATLGIVGLGWLFLTGAPPLDFTAYPNLGALHAAWLNGESFNPLKLRSVVGTLTMAGWSLNLVIWSLYAEMCAAPLLPLLHNLSRRGSGWLDAEDSLESRDGRFAGLLADGSLLRVSENRLVLDAPNGTQRLSLPFEGDRVVAMTPDGKTALVGKADSVRALTLVPDKP